MAAESEEEREKGRQLDAILGDVVGRDGRDFISIAI